MWNYEKRLQYPVNITGTNAKLAQTIISQFGGPDCNKIWYVSKLNLYSVFIMPQTALFHNCKIRHNNGFGAALPFSRKQFPK
jgi:hypothetical protein